MEKEGEVIQRIEGIQAFNRIMLGDMERQRRKEKSEGESNFIETEWMIIFDVGTDPTAI